jgi:hypothetical protein
VTPLPKYQASSWPPATVAASCAVMSATQIVLFEPGLPSSIGVIVAIAASPRVSGPLFLGRRGFAEPRSVPILVLATCWCFIVRRPRASAHGEPPRPLRWRHRDLDVHGTGAKCSGDDAPSNEG